VAPPGTERKRLRLPARRRLRRKAEFESVQRRGRRSGCELFVITARMNSADGPRLGLAVATKAAGNSVQRNRIRRLIRESFRLRQHELPPCDLVVSARAGVRGVDSRELRARLDALWDRVKQQCASSSPH
jgi:ribonuclease P protein component